MNGGGQYQIVIGTDVPQVYQEVVSSLKGEGFEPLVREGDRVKKGQLLLKFDMDVIKAHNLSVVTPVVVTNTALKYKIYNKIPLNYRRKHYEVI